MAIWNILIFTVFRFRIASGIYIAYYSESLVFRGKRDLSVPVPFSTVHKLTVRPSYRSRKNFQFSAKDRIMFVVCWPWPPILVSVTKTVLIFSDAVHSKAHNNQSCKHDLKLKVETVTVTGADDHYHGDGRSVIRAADGQWWTVTIMIEDV
jgi:hypothetical protein